MNIGLFGMEGLLLTVMAFTIWALLDVLRRPTAEWQRAGQSQLVWTLVVIFVGLIGPLVYLFVGRPTLVRAANADLVAAASSAQDE